MENQSKARVVRDVAVKSMLMGAFLGGWAVIFLQPNEGIREWAYPPAILSLILSLLLVTVGRRFLPSKVLEVLEEKPDGAIWTGFALAFLLMLITTFLAAFFAITRPGAGGYHLILFMIVAFELLGGLIGAVLFLIPGVIIGFIKVFLAAKAA